MHIQVRHTVWKCCHHLLLVCHSDTQHLLADKLSISARLRHTNGRQLENTYSCAVQAGNASRRGYDRADADVVQAC